MIDSAFIMCAGLGTRLRPFTNHCPKPLIPVLGIPTVYYGINSLVQFGIKNITANIHHLPNEMQNGLLEYKKFTNNSNLNFLFSDESKLLLGSAGGYKKALSLIGSKTFLSFNGDTVGHFDPTRLVKKHIELKKSKNVLMTLALIPSTHNFSGSFRELKLNISENLITGFGEVIKHVPFWSGWAVFESESFKNVSTTTASNFLETVLIPAIQSNQVGFDWYNGFWSDVGDALSWAEAHKSLMNECEINDAKSLTLKKFVETKSKKISTNIWADKNYSIPKSITLNAPAYLANQTFNGVDSIGPNAYIYSKPENIKQIKNKILFNSIQFDL